LNFDIRPTADPTATEGNDPAKMPTRPQKRPRRGLFVRVAVLSTLLVFLSVGPCAFLFIRQHRAAEWESLETQVRSLTNTVAALARPQSPGKDETLVNHCRQLFENPMTDYVIITGRNLQQPAIYYSRQSNGTDPCRPEWFPPPGETSEVLTESVSPWTGEPVLVCSRRIEVPGAFLGWAHVGLSLQAFGKGQAAAIRNTVVTVSLAALAGILGSFLLAQRVSRPLLRLCDMAQTIAEGDLRSRTVVSSTPEVRHLADHMNWMAEKLEENAALIREHQRELELANDDLRERVESEQLLSRISADFLHAESSAPDETFVASLERITRRLDIDGASIFLHDTADHATLFRTWEWHRAGAPVCQIERVPIAGFPWAAGLASELPVVEIADSDELPGEAAAERINLHRFGIRSAAAALLGTGEKPAGYLFLRNAAARMWTDREKRFIHLAAGILSNAIARRDAALERERLHAQLLQAQKMEAVGKLSGGIAHDFNNMLVPIVGYSDSILNRSPADAPWVEEIREIKRSAESAASLTRQLLSFSRKQIISRRELDLNGLIQQLQQMLRRLLGENIKLLTDLDPGLWSIAADPSQIEQCLMNLSVNAKAAMPHGGSIHIATEMMDSEDARFSPPPLRKIQGLFVRLTVRDSGCGMEPSTVARIFEPFFSTKGEEGTGLGLSVVYGVMEEHGGWISVESAPGKGSAFHLWLPALNEPLPQPMDAGLAVAPPLPKGSGERILLIEDEPGVLAFVSAALRQNGYHVLTADCGASARELFRSELDNLDLVMSDVVLPDTTGVQLLEEFFVLRPDLKALLSSGYSEKNSLVELVKKRGLFFLHKPYTLIQLLQAVHNALRGPSKIVVT
jgi:signal transduction histidine kinase/ActR/RegA family two-component response regulator